MAAWIPRSTCQKTHTYQSFFLLPIAFQNREREREMPPVELRTLEPYLCVYNQPAQKVKIPVHISLQWQVIRSSIEQRKFGGKKNCRTLLKPKRAIKEEQFQIYNRKMKMKAVGSSTSTIAVKTDSLALEPDFQVPNPTAGIVWPLNSLKDSASWSCGANIACGCAIIPFLPFKMVWLLMIWW